jgi:hypothetical protein
MSDPSAFKDLRDAVGSVKQFLAQVDFGHDTNDLVITGIADYGDLWLFTWNNGWPLLGRPEFAYPGCEPVAVFKADGRLLQLGRSYGWVEGSFESALDAVRAAWADSRGDQTV